MTKLGIFILPNKSIKNKILNLKKIVKKKFGSQKYLNHLPHCTIYVFNTTKSNLRFLKKIKFKIPIKNKLIKITKTDIFYNDPVTQGNTYILKIDKNNFLKKLQLLILKNFRKYSEKKKLKFVNKTMKKNYAINGYPFINSNWKPHFTIASISKGKDQINFKKLFREINTRYKQTVNQIYLYQIKKNQHKLICKIKI